MKINVWPVGCATLVKSLKGIPAPREFYGEWDGYRFFKTDLGVYAVED